MTETARTPGVHLRPLRPEEARASAELHREVLHMEFLSRCGRSFLECYHRAWIASPAGVAVAALDGEGALVGVLLGAIDPAAHFVHVFRRHGPALAARLLLYALTHPALARELVVTRGRRYAGGALRLLRARRAGTPPARRAGTLPAGPGAGSAAQVGEVTHLMVSEVARGSGTGRALLAETERIARRAGLDELVLVTPPDLAARRFYEHLGWEADGSLHSRSGEAFVRYRRPLR